MKRNFRMLNVIKKIFITTIFVLFNVFSFTGCDILRLSKFEVLSWSPGNGYHDKPEKIAISVKFSNSPDKASVEKNFSFDGNGERVKGNFIWEGKTLRFSPSSPLEKNTDYVINISADAHDKDGLSMDNAFVCNFTTRPDNTRPLLVSCYPEMYAQIDDQTINVRFEFSTKIPLKTLYDNVSFNPSMSGIWHLENDGKLAVFTPSEPWEKNTRYEIRVSSSLTGENGMSLRNDYISVFTTKTDGEHPRLLKANRIDKNGVYFKLELNSAYSGVSHIQTENQNWEKEDRFMLVFSEPVDSLSVKNLTVAENAPNLVMENPAEITEKIFFKFENIPAYESRFSIKIKQGIKDSNGNESKEEYVYKVFANGKRSKPPSLAGIRIPMNPSNAANPKLENFAADSLFSFISISDVNYPSGESVKTWIELYFDTAQEASVDPFSVMELFRIETSNNVISFSPRYVKTSGFTVSSPQTSWENYQRVEIEGILVNSTFFGIIDFQIASGLRDSFGNKNETLQKISVIK